MSKFHVVMDIETEDDVELDVIENDVRDYVQGEFDGASFDALPPYGITVTRIEVSEE